MGRQITVAAGGDLGASFMEGLRHPEDFVRPWDERPKAEIEVEDSDTLGSILERGNEVLGSPPLNDHEMFAFIDFFVEGAGSIGFRHELTLIDDEGHVRWAGRWRDEPFGEVLRAHEAGVFVGDPTRIYVLRQPGIGNGVLADFPNYIELMRLTFEVLGAVGTIQGVRGWMRDRIRRGHEATEAIEKHHDAWEANGAMPHKLWQFLRQKPWESDDLARALGVRVAEVESILIYFGYVRGADGLWRLGDDALSEYLAGNAEFLLHNPHIDRRWVRQYLEERLDEFVETGVVPELNWRTMPQMPVDPDWSATPAPGYEPAPQERAMDLLRVASQEARFWLREARARWRRRSRS